MKTLKFFAAALFITGMAACSGNSSKQPADSTLDSTATLSSPAKADSIKADSVARIQQDTSTYNNGDTLNKRPVH